MAKILKPRRGTANTMNGTKANTVLAAGEIFFEIPNSGVGSDKGKIKMGDGVTPYGSLPYFLEPAGDISSEEITVTADVSTSSASALANITSNKSVGSLIGSLKQAITLVKSETTSELNKLGTNSSDKLQFPIVRSGADYGYRNSDGVFSPFRKDSTETYRFSSGSGSTVDLGARNDYRYVNAETVYNAGYSAGVSDGTTQFVSTPFPVTTRQSSIDMGEHHTYRYVDSTLVPNENDETYTFTRSDSAVKDFGTENRVKKVDASNLVKNGKAAAFERVKLWELTSLKESSGYGYFEPIDILLDQAVIKQPSRVSDDDPGKFRATNTSTGATAEYNVGSLLNFDMLEVYVSVGNAASAGVHLSRIKEIKDMISNGVENINLPGNVSDTEQLDGNDFVNVPEDTYSAYCHVNYIDARRLAGLNYNGTSTFDVGAGGDVRKKNARVGYYPEILHAGGFNKDSDYSLSIYCRILGMNPGAYRTLKIGKCTCIRSGTAQNRNCIPYLIYGVRFKHYTGNERQKWSDLSKKEVAGFRYELI